MIGNGREEAGKGQASLSTVYIM